MLTPADRKDGSEGSGEQAMAIVAAMSIGAERSRAKTCSRNRLFYMSSPLESRPIARGKCVSR